MPKISTKFCQSQENRTGFLMKNFGVCCISMVLIAYNHVLLAVKSRYSCSEVCVRVARVPSLSLARDVIL